ncbi:MAG TPA: NADH-quinone oxidoreductase subunit C [Limnochordales bacterium]
MSQELEGAQPQLPSTPPEAAAVAGVGAELARLFAGQVEPQGDSFGTEVVKVRPTALRDVARWLKEAGFHLLLDVAGVDYRGRRPPEERFEVVYHLLDLAGRRRVRLKVALPEQEPTVATVSDLWPAAQWAEREVFDLFGVRFQGHPDLRRILMPDDWQGHPLRKDYPLRGPQRTPSVQGLRSRFFPVRAPEDDRLAGPAESSPASPPDARGLQEGESRHGT